MFRVGGYQGMQKKGDGDKKGRKNPFKINPALAQNAGPPKDYELGLDDKYSVRRMFVIVEYDDKGFVKDMAPQTTARAQQGLHLGQGRGHALRHGRQAPLDDAEGRGQGGRRQADGERHRPARRRQGPAAARRHRAEEEVRSYKAAENSTLSA